VSSRQGRAQAAAQRSEVFSQDAFDKAFLEARRKVAAEPMPKAPETIYDLRPTAVMTGRKG